MRYVMVLLCALLCVSPQVMAEVETITLTANEWPPYTSDHIEGGGLVVELITAAFAEEGIRTQYQIMPWARAIASVESREANAVAAWDSAERREIFHFSDRLLFNNMVLVKRDNNPVYWNTLDDLKPYSFVLVRGAVSLETIDQASDFKKSYVTTEETAIDLVIKGRADLTIRDKGVVEYLIQQKPERFAGRIDFSGKTLGRNALHLVVSKQHPRASLIITSFNRGLKKIKHSGQYQALMAKYGMTVSE